jgi:hypothetical protein
MNRRRFLTTLSASILAPWVSQADDETRDQMDNFLAGRLNWSVGPPLIMPANRPEDPCHAIKDPSIVYFGGRWHVFCTIRSQKRSHQIEYLSFADFENANKAERHVLKLTDGYFAAPQIFYFSPHEKWYLIYQVVDNARKPALQPAYSTTREISDPTSWSQPALLFSAQPENINKIWIDFWLICDPSRANLFFTTLDGQMWRAETKLSDFPSGWNRPSVVLRGDFFEASHTYHLRELNKFLTIIEAKAGGLLSKLLSATKIQAGDRRYYQAYLADRLDGSWVPLAITEARPFAGSANVQGRGTNWTDTFSHGELLREGFDETLALDPTRLRFLFQGASDEDRAGKTYSDIPWRLGLLEPA